MKALFTLLLIAFFLPLAGQAQEPVTPPTQTFKSYHTSGLKAGLNFSAISGLGEHLGFHAGFFFEERVRENSGYGLELLFNKIGAGSMDASYLTLPVLANLHAGSVTFQGGGFGALLLSAGSESSYGYHNVSGRLKGLDFGLTGGLKLRLFKKMGITARYYRGFQNLIGSSGKNRSRNLQVGLHYNF